MDDAQEMSCEACGAKLNSSEEMEKHKKDAHGGGEGGSTESGSDTGGSRKINCGWRRPFCASRPSHGSIHDS